MNEGTLVGEWGQWLERFNRLPAATQGELAESMLGRALELYLNPTEKCNYRCRYCYEDFKIGKMKPEVVDRLKKFISQNLGKRKRLMLNWFGGEPLLASDIVIDVSAYAKSLCSSLGVSMSGGITTNGDRLDADLARKLIELRLGFFQITLDGDGQDHDLVRMRPDGTGTFEKVWSNIVGLKDLSEQFTTLLRIHVRPGSEASLSRLISRINSVLGTDPRFIVGFHALANLGGPTGGTFDVLSEKEYADITSRLMSLSANTLRAQRMEGEIRGSMDCGAHVCYAAKPNAFFIRPDGRVGKCTVAMDKDYNSIGYLGEDGRIVISESKHRKWLRGIYSLESSELSCPLLCGDAYFRDQRT